MKAQWIKAPVDMGASTAAFTKNVKLSGKVLSATVKASSVGVYTLTINGRKVGDRVLTPGFTSYHNRVLYQTYDVTELLTQECTLAVNVGPGWAVGNMGFRGGKALYSDHVMAICELQITYEDGREELICTDESWEVYTHEVTFSDIYNGETVDKTHTPTRVGFAVIDNDDRFVAVEDNGAPICEHERIFPIALITTPKGERVIDFGQNMTGYVSLNIKGERGERVVLTFAEVLDADGNFYNGNYRSAKNEITYILSGEQDSFKPEFSFQGFRYARIEEYPDREIDLGGFCAIVVHTQMKRTGYFACGDARINQLYHNVIWGQKSNYLDIPTDCPQRDERLGWTGDAQVFCRTAGINYDVSKFFEKWLTDMRLEQRENGAIMGICPEPQAMNTRISTAWGDVSCIVPWTLYELYGDKRVLEDNFEMMRRWVEYMHNTGDEEYLWLTGFHYGDWLAMDAGEDSYVGATSNDLIASAYFAYSTELLVKAGKVLGKDMSHYEQMHERIVAAFREYFMENGFPKEELPYTEIIPAGKTKMIDTVRRGMTQTALVLILHFGLCTDEEREPLVQKLEQLIDDFGGKMTTGFVGTPYILHVLSSNGKQELAYKLLFNKDNPSWLYSVDHGATTMWEHWNGIKEDGSFWSTDMNSFNHYAYGAVADWMYGVIAGISINRGGEGYKDITVAPCPCERLGFVNTSIETPQGLLESNWYYSADGIKFEIRIPEGTVATIKLPDGYECRVGAGCYHFTVSKN